MHGLRPVVEAAQLESAMLKFEELWSSLRGTSDEPSVKVVTAVVRRVFSGLRPLAAIFAAAEFAGYLGKDGDPMKVLMAIRAHISRERDEAHYVKDPGTKALGYQAFGADGGGGAPDDSSKGKGKKGKSTKKCSYCGHSGHRH